MKHITAGSDENFVPSAPAGLSSEAAAIWRELVPTIGGLQTCDIPSLTLLCENMAILAIQKKHIASEGELLQHPNGMMYLNPRHRIIDKANAIIDRLLNRFRCNPMARRSAGQHSTDVVIDDKSEFFE